MTTDVRRRRDDRVDDRTLGAPRTTADLRAFVTEHLGVTGSRASELLQAIDGVVAIQRQMIEASKLEAIKALSVGFADKLDRLQQQLTE
ncbi:MAG TPA: hypothetical protein VNJ03_01300, partial [Vicinamibacterales bacterium]|nr:hypothetical protein [Vicinamibacterales bacterium]